MMRQASALFRDGIGPSPPKNKRAQASRKPEQLRCGPIPYTNITFLSAFWQREKIAYMWIILRILLFLAVFPGTV